MHGQRSSRFQTDMPTTNHGRKEVEEASTRVGGVLRSGRESVQHVVSEYPLSTILGSFALGAAVGVALGLVLSESTAEPRWYERVPEPLGRRWIESFLQVLPESVRSKVT